jgi:hypothetical protein
LKPWIDMRQRRAAHPLPMTADRWAASRRSGAFAMIGAANVAACISSAANHSCAAAAAAMATPFWGGAAAHARLVGGMMLMQFVFRDRFLHLLRPLGRLPEIGHLDGFKPELLHRA